MNETNDPITIHDDLLYMLRPARCQCCADTTYVNVWLTPLSSCYRW